MSPGKLLRSWIKEERREGPLRWDHTLPLTILLVAVVVATTAAVRGLQERHRHEDDQATILTLVETSLHDLQASARHWSRWAPLTSALNGADPQAVRQQISRSEALYRADQLLLFNASKQLQLAHSGNGQPLAPEAESVRCVQEQLDAAAVKEIQPIACAVGKKQIQLGVIAPLQTWRAQRSGQGTVALLRPIHPEAADSGSDSRMGLLLARHLAWRTPTELGTQPLPLQPAATPVKPVVSGPKGAVLALLNPILPLVQGRSLLPDLLLVSVVLAAVLATRAIPLLERRQRRLIHLQAERLATRRIQRTSRKLDRLLERLGPSSSSSRTQPVEDEVMAKLFGAPNSELESAGEGPRHLTAQVEHKLSQVASSFERLLSTAKALALFDSLTDLPNRRYFFERLAIESQRARRSDTPFVIMFIDVDKFKMINDTYGHHVGDAALIAVADHMRAVSRREDFISRYGGDEFALIMDLSAMEDRSEDNLKAQAYQFAVRLTERFQEPIPIAGMNLPVSLSVGITLVDSQEADPQQAIQRSDAAMYQAKNQIDTRISIFDVSSNKHELDSYRLFADLQTALHKHDLRILYQPIIDVHHGLHAVEALVRWRHPELGDIPPDVLLNIADHYRLTLPLGLELITLAARGYASLRASLGGDPRLALNISGHLLSHPQMGQTILNLLDSQLVHPQKVTLEITEQSVMEMGRTTEENLQYLRASGMQLSLDDFGTGHSSLMRLITLQPSELKIDKAFVTPLQTDPNALRVVSLVATLARRMNLRVVAEGVETQEISEVLTKLGITHQQGFYFSHARSSGDLIAAGQRAFQRFFNPEGARPSNTAAPWS
ncbi:diguanylate cyclase/phosphodiesterase with PAS/PAC and GAF sensor [Cyanobium sp. PCC 7001]|uniref:putative bifunctional diguanylate cyclase/phosphodiesterase n=1 Tax=Cyanobium sp. PCC 7001 TaxID=180281 RepID=UPI00018056B0|nr:EAL domain-containing protein [Cyanobium sp. PCC 7001]EDY38490.1 diguanylate cyclase/phosphodiesterase with PAS/PAC and GAF sensor [Cyanobium sp. PCC 7001]